MIISVELFGIARSRAGVSEWDQSFADEANVTLETVLRELVREFPQLEGECIANGGLTAAFVVNLNGARFVRDRDTRLKDGDCLLLLSADAGG